MKKLAKAIRVVAVNAIVLIVLLGGIEFYFRHWGNEKPDGLLNGLWQSFQPYVMVTTAPGEYRRFFNTFTNETYPSTVRTNSLGYNDRHEFIVGRPYKKAANEKVVLFTGGSAAWGVGATATDRTVAGNAWAMVEGRDSNDPQTGVPVHFGVVSFDLQKAVTTKSSGDLAKLGVAAAKDGWVKVTFDLLTKDGRIYVTANLLEGSNGLMNFQGAGQNVVFGGVEIAEQQ
jgi:hypothetical protein